MKSLSQITQQLCDNYRGKCIIVSDTPNVLFVIWINAGSDNGLLPDGTKPLLEPVLTSHQRDFDSVAFTPA